MVVFGTFFPALKNNFVNYDDLEYVTENVHVLPGLTWEGIRWAFHSTLVSNWHPLTWLSHMLDCQLYGVKPWGHHLTNVLLHTANALLLFIVLRKITGAVWRSLLVAVFFGLHPLTVQSVAWIAERKDVLSTLFWLLTIWFYASFTIESKARKPISAWFYGLTLICFALGLMSKSMLVTLPCVLLLLDYWPLERWRENRPSRLLAEKIPFFLLSFISSKVTFMAQKAGGSVATIDHLSYLVRFENTLVSYIRYLGKLFWPDSLAVLYPHPGGWPVALVIWSGLLLLAITIGVTVRARKNPYLPVGWFWFLGTLVPVIGLVQVGMQSMADRYMYVPMMGVLILIIWGCHDLFHRQRQTMIIMFILAAIAAVLCIGITRQQIAFWQNSENLFRHDLMVAPDNNPTAHYKLGVVLNEQGKLDEAAYHFQENLKLNPDDFHALFALGVISNIKNQPATASALFQAVLKLKPDYADAHYSLGVALGQQGHLDEAMIQFQEALRLKPDYFDAHISLGVALGRKGQLDDAISHFQAALKLKPNDISALYNLGLALKNKGQLAEAVSTFRKILELKPDYVRARNNLNATLQMMGAPAFNP